ncbi:MAG: hypothetical protein ACJAY5_001375 [Actinomycetes bacterium]|jgi:hypothetical protein
MSVTPALIEKKTTATTVSNTAIVSRDRVGGDTVRIIAVKVQSMADSSDRYLCPVRRFEQ